MIEFQSMDMPGKPQTPNITEDHLLEKRIEVEALYQAIGAVQSPFLKDKVNFNSMGLEHLKFKSHGKPRNKSDQYIRLKLLYLAPEIIKKSHTLQGTCKRKEWERQKRHGTWESVPIDVTYHEFIAVIGKLRMKVIIKKIGDGEHFFWSVIPFWKMKSTNERVLNEGNPEID